MSTRISITVDGKAYDGWERVTLTRSMLELAHTFDFQSPDGIMASGEDPVIAPGQKCTITIGDTTVSSGYIDSAELGYDPEGRFFNVAGRSKTCDVVDCSAIWPSGRFSRSTVASIARALCARVDVPVVALFDSPTLERFAIVPGETIFEAITRIARMSGLLLWTDAQGRLVIDRSGHYALQKPSYEINESTQIRRAMRTIDFSSRFRNYIGKSQSAQQESASTKAAQQGRIDVEDSAITRVRDLIIVPEDQATASEIRARTKFERNTRRGMGDVLEFTFAELQTRDGHVFSPSDVVRVSDSYLRAELLYICTSVEMVSDFEQGDSCTVTLMDLGALDVDPVPLPRMIQKKSKKRKSQNSAKEVIDAYRKRNNGGKND